MILDLHESDQHAPFAHYIVSIPARSVVVRDPHSRKRVTLERDVQECIVCYFCGHWIERPLKNCTCPASCHTEALAARE